MPIAASVRADVPDWPGSCCDATPAIGRRRPAGPRDPAVRRPFCSIPPAAARWRAGDCTFVEDATTPADRAHILWSASVDPDVLMVVAEPAGSGAGAFDLAAFADAAAVRAGDQEHVFIRGAGGSLRLDVVAGTVLDGPVLLAHRLTGLDDLDARMRALRQLSLLCQFGAHAPWAMPDDPRLDRLVRALRILDARSAGASLRDVAVGLDARNADDWPGEGESTKSWVRRLVALSDALWRAGPLGVLSHAI